MAVNAIKSTGTFATTIAAGQTLGVTSGMMLNTSGTRTITGGTIAFGSNPGVFFAGTTGAGGFTISSAITGTAGLINANSALHPQRRSLRTYRHDFYYDRLRHDHTWRRTRLPARSRFAVDNSTSTPARRWPVRARSLLGAPENDDHLVNNFAQVNFSGAGANAIIGRDIIVDHGSYDAAGLQTTFGFLPTLAPLSNTTGSQTLSGNITLNSPVRLQGGGGGGTGSTILSGNISGPAQFYLTNGRELLTGSYGNAGGFRVGERGFTAQVSFLGTPIGSAPINFQGGNNTFIAYNSGSLPTGPITVEGTTPRDGDLPLRLIRCRIRPSTTPLFWVAPSTRAPSPVTSPPASPETGMVSVSGAGGLIKNGTGTLVLGNSNTYTGNTTVNAGFLLINGTSASADHYCRRIPARSAASGSVGPVTVNTGGTLSPGNSIGTFGTGSLTLSGTFLDEIDLNNGGAASADLTQHHRKLQHYRRSPEPVGQQCPGRWSVGDLPDCVQ